MILGGKTLEEAFTSVNLEVSHLRIFGCLVYTHVLVEKRRKLEPSSMKALFVRYNETYNAYMIYILAQTKTMISRDVMLEEKFAFRKLHESILAT